MQNEDSSIGTSYRKTLVGEASSNRYNRSSYGGSLAVKRGMSREREELTKAQRRAAKLPCRRLIRGDNRWTRHRFQGMPSKMRCRRGGLTGSSIPAAPPHQFRSRAETPSVLSALSSLVLEGAVSKMLAVAAGGGGLGDARLPRTRQAVPASIRWYERIWRHGSSLAPPTPARGVAAVRFSLRPQYCRLPTPRRR